MGSDAGAAWAVAIAAPAKLNLYLHVVGRRPDGYHLLDSLVAFAAEHDTVQAAPAEGLSLIVDGPFASHLAAEADNLVLRAARLLQDTYSVRAGARLRLTKRLPVASGIGGGSTDAAATLRALIRLWGLHVAPSDLVPLGGSLGADVPVCILGRTARLSGIGERLEPLPPLPPLPLVLVNPGVPVSTPTVFARRSAPFSSPAETVEGDLVDMLAKLGNDLCPPALTVAPVIAQVLTGLDEQPGCRLARLSGSGATCFGLFKSGDAAAAAASRIAAGQPGWWVRASRLVSDVCEMTADQAA